MAEDLQNVTTVPVTADDPSGRKWTWEEDGYTVIRGNARTAPGCHDNCGVLMYMKDGKLDHVEGDPEDPYNQGRLCLRCLCVPDVVYHEDRQLYPMKRKREDRGKDLWERITWEEAFDICEQEIKTVQEKYGKESVAVLCGTGRDVLLYYSHLAQAMGTPNGSMGFLSGQSCYVPRIFSTNLKSGGLFQCDYSQFFADRYEHEGWRRPDYTVIWGNNPVVANSDGTLGHWIVECMKRGTKLITIDPKLTWVAAHSEFWLQVRPGTDTALALSFGYVIVENNLYDHEFVDKWTFGFEAYAENIKAWTPERAAEVCGIDADIIEAAALALGNAESWGLQWGVAMDHTSEGFYTGMACWDLVGLCGQFERPGGMLCGMAPFDCGIGWVPAESDSAFIPKDPDGASPVNNPDYLGISVLGMPSPDQMLVAMETGEPYPIKAIWMQSNNPIANMGAEPERILKALQSMDFNVVTDLWMTPTALACADIFLPCACFTERPGITGHQPYRIGAVVKAMEPLGEAKSDQTICVEMARRFAGEEVFPWTKDEDYYDFLLQQCGSGFTYDDIKKRSWAYPEVEYYRYETGKLRADGTPGFNSPTGRYEFTSVVFQQVGMPILPEYIEPYESPVSTPVLAKEYPLVLTTGARQWGYFHSEGRQIPHLRRIHPEPEVTIHPETAKEYGIGQGDWVLIENQLGSCKQKANLDIRIKKDVVSADHGWWFPERDHNDGTFFGTLECNINNLLPMRPGKTGLGNSYKSQLCRISRDQS